MGAARRTVRWAWLGRVPYAEAEALQHRLRDALATSESGEWLLLLEHPHVYTLGRNASRDDLLASREWLAMRGVEVAECDRGGRVTYHGPGQLVGYPILDLDPDRRDLRRYVRDLMAALVGTAAEFGVDARPASGDEPIGVWAGGAKLASLGVHIRRWITTHGFALNVSTDLSMFAGIVACGLPAVRIASIESLTGLRPELSAVAERFAARFGETFDREMAPASDPQASRVWSTAS